MSITAELLHTWAERLCTLPQTDGAEVLRALGIAGDVVPRFGALHVEPLPPGARELKAVVRDGKLARVDLQLEPGTPLTRADLEQALGHGIEATRVHAHSYYGLTYRLAPAGAPYACEVFADFAPGEGPPGDAAPVSGLSLRRQAPPAQPQAKVTLTEIVEILGAVGRKLQQQDGAELRRRLEEVRDRVDDVSRVAATAPAETAPQAAAPELEKLLTALRQTGAAATEALQRHGATLRSALHNLDLAGITETFKKFAEYLADPTPENQAKAKELVARIEAATGKQMGPAEAERARQDEERRAAIKRDVQASLDEIFRGAKKPSA
jgi:hypothetical protein